MVREFDGVKSFKELNFKDLENNYKVHPINEEQKFYAAMLSSKDFQIGVVTGSTGSLSEEQADNKKETVKKKIIRMNMMILIVKFKC